MRDLEKVGPFELLTQVGSGATSAVWAARDSRTGQSVALKVMRATEEGGLLNEQRFLDEARIGGMLAHPNLAPVLEAGRDGETPYFVLELLQGLSLSALLSPREEGFEPALAVGLCIQALAGLRAVHEARSEQGLPLALVHRDIKPSNLFLCHDGTLKVIDFGIASAARLEQTRTRTGGFRGSIPYASPEQARGETQDARSDLFSLGLVLHELLTGRRVFSQPSDAAVLTALLFDPIPPLRSTVPWVSRALEDVVMRALEKDVAARVQSAAEFSAALAAALVPERPWGKDAISRWLGSTGPAPVRRPTATWSIGVPTAHAAGAPMEVGPRRSFSRVALVLGCLSALALPGAPGGMNERAHREPDSPLRSAQVLAEHLDPNAVPEFGKLLADAYGAQNTALFTETAIAQTKLLGNLGRTSEATASFQLARAAAARSRVTRADALVLEVLAALTARGAGRRDEAIQRARKLVETAHALPAEMELNRAEVLMGVSATLTYQETQAEAEAAVREALEIRRRRLGENNVRTCMTYDNLSGILGVQGKLEEALEASRRAHACVEVAAGAESALRGEVDVNLGDALALTGRIEAARAIDEEGLRILGKELGPTNADVLMLENNLARLSLVDRPREAAEHYERTLFASEHTLPTAAPERLRSVVGAERCRAWRSVARAREAVVRIREALASQVNDPSGGSDFDVAVTMFALAETIERAQPHTAEARDLAQRALVHFDRLHCVFDRDRVQAWLRSLPT